MLIRLFLHPSLSACVCNNASNAKNSRLLTNRKCCVATLKPLFKIPTVSPRSPPAPCSKTRKFTTSFLKKSIRAAATRATVSLHVLSNSIRRRVRRKTSSGEGSVDETRTRTPTIPSRVDSLSGNNGSGSDLKVRSRYNGRQVQSLKQDVVEKFEKKKEETIARHHHEVRGLGQCFREGSVATARKYDFVS